MPELPGLTLSILRQDTVVQAGKPLLISGRLTFLGLGVPAALIRVFVEGPDYDPQIRKFDTSTSLTGDYNTNIVAEKDGSYFVFSQAFPLPAIPLGPAFPEPPLPLPSVAESPRPPLAVGQPVEGGVRAQLPGGPATIPTPPREAIEFAPAISIGAPGISISLPGIGGVGPPTVLAPFFPGPAQPPTLAAPPAAAAAPRAGAAIDSAMIAPESIQAGGTVTGLVNWRNTGSQAGTFDVRYYLSNTARYGPLQLEKGLRVPANAPFASVVRFGTQGVPAGVYGLQVEVSNSDTGASLASSIFPGRLTIRAAALPVIPTAPIVPTAPVAPVVPTVPTIPTVPTAPTVPTVPTVPTAPAVTPGIGEPAPSLPTEVTVGETWSGSISIPTIAL